MKGYRLVTLLFAVLFATISQAESVASLDKVQEAVQAAIALAKENKVTLSCAVVDARGDLIMVARMDGARFFTTGLAEGKALTAAMLRRPSGEVQEMAASPLFQTLNVSLGGRMLPVQGAVPIFVENQVVAGIGCSGAAPQIDESAAKAGAAVF